MLPLVVTISGRVSSDTPISCEHSGLRGVIVDQTVNTLLSERQNLYYLFFFFDFLYLSALKAIYTTFSQAERHFLKHNDAGSWIQDSALLLSHCNEVPWYLVRLFLLPPLNLPTEFR